MLSCSIWFSAPSFWMGGGLESRCVGRVWMLPCNIHTRPTQVQFLNSSYIFRPPPVVASRYTHQYMVSPNKSARFNFVINLCVCIHTNIQKLHSESSHNCNTIHPVKIQFIKYLYKYIKTYLILSK